MKKAQDKGARRKAEARLGHVVLGLRMAKADFEPRLVELLNDEQKNRYAELKKEQPGPGGPKETRPPDTTFVYRKTPEGELTMYMYRPKDWKPTDRQTGRALDAGVDPQWLWKQRRVYAYDGSTVSMPDTAENQLAYPQPVVQKPGLGFPLARIAAVFSLACGAVLDMGICRYAGKGQSEFGMLRTLWNLFLPGDVLLADRLMCAWTEMVMLKQRGVDCVCHFTSHRKADFRRGKRLGPGDHVVKWL